LSHLEADEIGKKQEEPAAPGAEGAWGQRERPGVGDRLHGRPGVAGALLIQTPWQRRETLCLEHFANGGWTERASALLQCRADLINGVVLFAKIDDEIWEELEEFEPAEFLGALVKQLYLDAGYVPHFIHLPVDFEDSEAVEEILSERRGSRVEVLTPQRGQKRALLELVQKNAAHSFQQRFRVLRPSSRAIGEALQSALGLEQPPRRIEAFDVSHLHGAETVASLVVWEDGRLKKSDYRKFIIRTAAPGDDFAAMKEAVGRRYRRLQEEKKPLPDLILVDGGLGQLHAAAAALEELEIINQPLASIAKKEEVVYVFGQETDPLRLERHSPVLHLIQQIRDETHRFAVTFHRQRRAARDLRSELRRIPGIGEKTLKKLLTCFGSLEAVRQLSQKQLETAVTRRQAAQIIRYFRQPSAGKS